ncbi:TPA: collagenase [Clostridium botulinum]|nr:collagenase [Clostridium botulinum]NFA97299.1 PKD domain-containing protein [Clostridium botulinum]NFB54214.1 PKD domain-containing protein [Clostridium botulinum]NFB55582.1 PKD domain-containing protein [Clostridium botulinum]NFB59992.1 PKD domain-containing protein [Clostridium botulinum]NFC76650.1 PKD domain-containing protein [Clostridium botulinum]
MKKKFIKMICSIAIGCMISTSCIAKVSAAPTNNTKINSNEINISEDSSKSERMPSTKSKPLGLNATKANSSKYSFSDLNKLSNKEILDLTSKIKWNDISDLFQYNDDSYAFYSNRERVQALIDGLYEKASTYTSTDDKGIDTLVEILRSGFYLGFYNDSLKYLNDRSFQDKCIPAMLAIENNKDFRLGEKGQDTVINALGKLIGNASCNAEVVNKTVPILEQYYREMNKYPRDKLKADAVYSLMKEINYDISEYAYDHNIRDGKNTPWSSKIDPFINTISKFAGISKVTEDNGWIINNGIYYTSKFAIYHSSPSIPHSVIDKCLEILPAYSEQYYFAVERIKEDFNSKDSKGNVIDIDKLLEDGKKHYLPKTYTFDNGKMIIKAGDKVDESKIQRLYWASKEVKSQFHRIIGNDKPLEAGNADDVLTMVIYNSPEEYKLNRTLYGYSVDNGGIYIEGIGTFFTYERTPEESIYSLEELFRHEFTHYLQGRYLVPGLFNEGDFYKGNSGRITWFEEGSAEFFAGSTRTSVLPRKSMVGGLSQNPKERFSADKILHSKYDDGWEFYKYGYAFSDYMYNNNKKLFSDLVSTMKNNDVKGYENLIEKSSKDFKINKDYQDHMQKLVDNYDSYTIPLVSDDYMKKYDTKALDEIKSDIEKTIGLTNSQITKENSQYFDTYTLKSTYTLDSNKGEIDNWNCMNNKVNESLEKLNKLGWGGYKTVTAYFSNPKVNSYNQVEYNVVFHGLLTHNKNFNEAPTIKLDFPKKSNTDEKIKFSSEGSTDDGKIVSYAWDFGDGETSSEKNPTHAYKTPGTYTVKLTVTDDKGLKAEKTSSITINKVLKGNVVSEKEDNNDFTNANPVYSKDLVNGSVSSSDNKDTFYFTVTKPSDITITVEKTNKDKSEFNWLLFNDEDKSNYIAFPNKKLGDQLSNTVKIDKPGKYYLVIYKTLGEKVDYKFSIEGDILASPEGDKDKLVISEKENNDSFDKANRVGKNQTVIATLDTNDNRDTYYFDALTAGTIDVIMENTDNNTNTFNWLAYSSDNTNNYIGYPTKKEGNKIMGSFKVPKPGRYYILAYKNSSNKINYKLNINGDIDTAPLEN